MTRHNGNAQASCLSAPRTPACHSGARFAQQPTNLSEGRQDSGPPAALETSLFLDWIEDELDHLSRAFAELRPASDRPGPARAVATHIAYTFAFLNRTRLNIEREVGI